MTANPNDTPDQAEERKLLELANENGKLAIQYGFMPSPAAQLALERLQMRRWIQLIDLSPIQTTGDGRPMRIFLVNAEALHFLGRVQ